MTVVAIGLAGCGGSSAPRAASPKAPEVSPAGDIPDNQAYVPYVLPGAGVTVKVPEGWSRNSAGGAVTFTDKLNAIRVETVKAAAAPTVRDVARAERARVGATARVSTVRRRAGTAIRTTYLAAAKANAVTGKAGRDAVERYVFFHAGTDLVLTLSGPKGADNVDPWKIVTDSVQFTR
jgi:hypothetical protein